MTTFKGYRILIGVALLLASASLFLSVLLFTRLATATIRTNDSLCTFRADVQRRAEAGEKFLNAHPQGIPGVPVSLIRESLEGQQRTVKALARLHCPPVRP